MATYNIFLTRLNSSVSTDSAKFTKDAQLPDGTTVWQAGEQWLGARRNDNKGLWYIMQEVSKKNDTDVLGLTLQTDASTFELRAYSKGKEVRKLLYSLSQGGWVHATGAPQDWEDTFFAPEAKAESLAEFTDDASQIATAFDSKTISVGSAYPMASKQSTVDRLMKKLGCAMPKKKEGKKAAKKGNWFLRLFGIGR